MRESGVDTLRYIVLSVFPSRSFFSVWKAKRGKEERNRRNPHAFTSLSFQALLCFSMQHGLTNPHDRVHQFYIIYIVAMAEDT